MTVTGQEPAGPGGAAAFDPLIATAVSDRCSNCGAELAPDQRYCVECGTRRGRARFSLPGGHPAGLGTTAPSAGSVAGVTPLTGVRTISSSAALLGTVALLLLAMGVGVLIGTSGRGSTAPKVTVYGGGSAGSAAGTAATGGAAAAGGAGAATGSGASRTSKASKAAAAPVAKPGKISATSVLHPTAVNPKTLHTTAQRKQAITSTLKKTVPLSNGKKLAPETQKLGGSCAAGTVGCVNGKYTGQFF